MVLRDLQEQAGVRTALVQLSGRMQAARAVAERRRDAVAIDDRFANRRDLLVDGRIGRDVRHRGEVVAGLRKVHERAEHCAKILCAFSALARARRLKKARACPSRRSASAPGSFLLRANSARMRLVLSLLSCTPGCANGSTPITAAAVTDAISQRMNSSPRSIFVRQRDLHGRDAGFLDRLERGILRRIGAVAQFEINERRDPCRRIFASSERLVADRNDTVAVLARAFGDQLLDPQTERADVPAK